MTPGPGSAAARWAAGLASWALPEQIVAQAPASPWGFPPGLFAATARAALAAPPTATHLRCLQALPRGGTVLDVGAGGGAASLPLAPAAARVVAVDESAEMLAVLADLADGTVEVVPVVGRWPDVAAEVPPADVVVCANVAYNVADLAPFVAALTDRSGSLVVLELTTHHPLSWLNPLWRRFWDLERPTGPVAQDALDVVRETLGVQVRAETWQRPHPLGEQDPASRVSWVRRRLCLSEDRDPEVAEALTDPDLDRPVEVVTAWWEPPARDHRAR